MIRKANEKLERKIKKNDQPDSQRAVGYFHQHQEKYLKMLANLVAIPSVSFTGFDQKEVFRCAKEVAKYCESCGLENVEVLSVGSTERPYVYGDFIKSTGAPTVLLYAHYDVQPPGDRKKWKSEPFTLKEREGRLFGRGASDDKGGIIAHLAAIDSWLRTSSPALNVKVLFEGEEEIGSTHLNQFVKKFKSKIQADMVVIADAENFNETTPGLTISLRGLAAVQVEIKTLKQSLHSGLWGGPIPDAAMALAKILSTLVDESGDIAVPAIKKMIPQVNPDDREALRILAFKEKTLRLEAGLLPEVPLVGRLNEARERLWLRPSLAINAIQSSSRAQSSNIVVENAWAKVGIRIVHPMKKEDVFEALKTHIEQVTPFGLKAEITVDSFSDPWKTQTDHWAFEWMSRSLEKGWGRKPVAMGCGASIPIVHTFSEALKGAPSLLLGMGDPLSAPHSENESLSLHAFKSSVESLIYLLGSK